MHALGIYEEKGESYTLSHLVSDGPDSESWFWYIYGVC